MGQWRRQGRDNQELSVKIVDRQIAYQTDDDDDDDRWLSVSDRDPFKYAAKSRIQFYIRKC